MVDVVFNSMKEYQEYYSNDGPKPEKVNKYYQMGVDIVIKSFNKARLEIEGRK